MPQQATPTHGQMNLANHNAMGMGREVSPKGSARIHSMEPTQGNIPSNKKIVLNANRTVALSERDPSLDAVNQSSSGIKNVQLSSAYNEPGQSANKYNPTMTQRKSRGRDGQKNQNASVDPPNMHNHA